jgi:hypothetical protein
MRERDHVGDTVVDGMIFRWILRKWDEGLLSYLNWLRIGKVGGHL